MEQKLYLECESGISGDMTVAALLDLGAEEEILKKALQSLALDGYCIKISRVKKSGIAVCDFDVQLDKQHENQDHDMNYLHGPAKSHGHKLEEGVGIQGAYCHEQRGLPEILHLIDEANLTPRAKSIATNIFRILAKAEAQVHGVEENKVHFHEVGAVDSIVDIVSIAVCIDNLNVTEVIVPYLTEGKGVVRCQHGILPVPVPAVTAIAQKYGLILHRTEIEGELVTPTGAATIAALQTSDELPKKYRIIKTGMGAGKRTYERPSILRAMLIEEKSEQCDTIYQLETNVDDCTGEALGYVMDRLLRAGARDVNYMPVFMKKNRPAYQLNVLCIEEKIEELEQIIFEETTTIGIRRVEMQRTVLARRKQTIDTSIGKAQVKVCENDTVFRVYPEYESVVELCEKNQMSFYDVYHLIQKEYK